MGSNRRRRRRRRGGNRGRQDTQQDQQQAQPDEQPAERPSQPRRGASSSRRRERSSTSRSPGVQRIRASVDSFGGFLTIGAVVIAVGAVIVLIILNRPGGGAEVGEGEFVAPATEAPVDGRLLGNPDAPVRIVAFEDFSCSHCGTFSRETKPLIEEEYINAGLVSIEYRHLALLGPDSERAGAASECAADQNLFWPYHDILFARQGGPGWASNGNLKNFAREMNDALGGGGLDLDAFDDCVDAGVKEFTVQVATEEAVDLIIGIGDQPSTPKFFINGALRIRGAQPIEAFRAEIDRVLAAAGVAGDEESAAPESGPPVDGRLLGNPDAPVRLVAFEDFSCSHCADFSGDTKSLIEEEYINDGLVSIEFRHFAILGADSERAAAASECAADQNLFWPYHDVLFARQGGQGWASDDNLRGFAREMNEALGGEGLELDAFDACVDSGAKVQTVRDATDEAGQSIVGAGGQPSTPTFFINDAPAVQGARPIEVFREAIEAALDAAGAGGG